MAAVGFGVLALSILAIGAVQCDNRLFQPCRASDPELNKCVKAIADQVVVRLNDGLPELNIEGFDPYSIDDIHSKELGNIELHFTNNKVYGARSNRIHDIKFDPVGRSIELSLSSTGFMISKYKLNGTLIILPVQGEGTSNLTIVNTHYIYKLNYDIVKGKDGKDHWKIVKQQASYTPERLIFDFKNLFNGNKQLSDVIHQFANENWREILAELGVPIMKKITRRTVKQIGKIFAAIPAEDLIIP